MSKVDSEVHNPFVAFHLGIMSGQGKEMSENDLARMEELKNSSLPEVRQEVTRGQLTGVYEQGMAERVKNKARQG